MFKTRVPARPTEFDADRWTLNVPNGTIDLRSGDLRPHRCEDMLTKMGGVEYDPEAACPQFEQYLHTLFDGDDHLIDHVQKLVGMTLAGEIRDHAFIIIHGPGGNGKSQFVKLVSSFLGDYACKVQPEVLTPTKSASASGASSHLARLAGYRFACCDETELGDRLAESLVKRITGGDTVVARGLYKSETEFDPQLTLWLDTNHKPSIGRGGHAIWRRIQLIPFTVTFSKDNDVKNIADKILSQEGPGIMRWAIEGCLRWQREGLEPLPEAVRVATQAYQEEEDKVRRFVSQECVLSPNARVKSSSIYNAYRAWVTEQGLQPEGNKIFKRRLEEEYGVTTHSAKDANYILGINIKVVEEPGGWGVVPEVDRQF
jgi:putative DNA primase/helicase